MAEARAEIAEEYARRGLWALAVEAGPTDDLMLAYKAAAIALAAGDEAAYRGVCARIRDRVPRRLDKGIDHVLVWPLLLVPGGIGEPARALPLVNADAPSPSYWENHAVALVLYRSGRFEEAVRRIHQWDDRRPDYWLSTGLDDALLAMALHRLGRAEEARRALEGAEAAQSRTARTIFERDGEIARPPGGIGRRAGPPSRGRADHPGKAGPDPPLATLAAARLYAKLGRTDLAEAGFRAAVAAAPDDPEVWLARGEILAELGHRDRSEADLARAAALPAADPVPWIHHGRWLAGRGDHSGADAAFARAARLTPDELNRFIEAGWWVVGPYPERPVDPLPAGEGRRSRATRSRPPTAPPR